MIRLLWGAKHCMGPSYWVIGAGGEGGGGGGGGGAGGGAGGRNWKWTD